MRLCSKRTVLPAIALVGFMSSTTSAQLLPPADTTLASALDAVEAIPSRLRGTARDVAGFVNDETLTNVISELDLDDQSIEEAIGKVEELTTNLTTLRELLNGYSNLTPEFGKLRESVESALDNTTRARATLGKVLEKSFSFEDTTQVSQRSSTEASNIGEEASTRQNDGLGAKLLEMMVGWPQFEALKALDVSMSSESLMNLNLLSIASGTKTFSIDLSMLEEKGFSRGGIRKVIESGTSLASELRISNEWLDGPELVEAEHLVSSIESLVDNLSQVERAFEEVQGVVREIGSELDNFDLRREFQPIVEQAAPLADLPDVQVLQATNLFDELQVVGDSVSAFNAAAQDMLDLTDIGKSLRAFSLEDQLDLSEIVPLDGLDIPTIPTAEAEDFVQSAIAAGTETLSEIQNGVGEYFEGMQTSPEQIPGTQASFSEDTEAHLDLKIPEVKLGMPEMDLKIPEMDLKMPEIELKAVKTATSSLASYLQDKGVTMDQGRLTALAQQISGLLSGENAVSDLLNG